MHFKNRLDYNAILTRENIYSRKFN